MSSVPCRKWAAPQRRPAERNMKVLGIVDATQNSAACLVENGEILACVQEERLSRVKHCGGFPVLAIREVLRATDTRPGEINVVRAGFSEYDLPLRLLSGVLNPGPTRMMDHPLEAVKVAGIEAYRRTVRSTPLVRLDTRLSKGLFGRRVRGTGLGAARVEHVNHHLSHVAACHFTSGFDRALALSIDAYGDGFSGGVYACMGRDIERLSSFPLSASLGYFYGCITELLGMRFGIDEGKTMVLAFYGKPLAYGRLKGLFSVDGLELRGDAVALGGLSTIRYSRLLSGDRKRDIAASAQDVLEDVVTELVTNAMDETGLRNVELSGGLFLNVKLNSRVAQLDGVDDVFVHPDAGDGGCAVGAALSAFAPKGRLPRSRMDHAYLGPGAETPTLRDMERAFGRRVQVSEHADVAGLVGSELLPAGKLVGVYWGRMEHGPRALGNRSVLADPTNPASPHRIRTTIKRRPEYQPFCQTVLDRDADAYIENPKGIDAPFMIIAFPATERSREDTPAVVHVDGSCRPQVLSRDVNEPYYRLIEAFAGETGVPVVLNTSFNRSGEPIVHTAEQAVNDLFEGGLDAVVIGDLIVERA